jgi:precorrin-6x reductase
MGFTMIFSLKILQIARLVRIILWFYKKIPTICEHIKIFKIDSVHNIFRILKDRVIITHGNQESPTKLNAKQNSIKVLAYETYIMLK